MSETERKAEGQRARRKAYRAAQKSEQPGDGTSETEEDGSGIQVDVVSDSGLDTALVDQFPVTEKSDESPELLSNVENAIAEVRDEYLGQNEQESTSEDKGVTDAVNVPEIRRSPQVAGISLPPQKRHVGRPRASNPLSAAERKALWRAKNRAEQEVEEPVVKERDYQTPTLVRGVKKSPGRPRAVSDGILARAVIKQDNKCLACDREFGSLVTRNGKVVTLTATPDHFRPRALKVDNSALNIHALCQVCNGIKSSYLFETVGEMEEFIRKELDRLGWKTAPPLVPFRRDLIVSSKLIFCLSFSEGEEASYLNNLLRAAGLPNESVIAKHLVEAGDLYTQDNDHAALGQSRVLLQSVVDDIGVETDRLGRHSKKIPGGTANRIDYLNYVGFLSADERASILSAWGFLSAGNHPGVPPRELARIGLVLAIEYAQVLLLKHTDWKASGCAKFSSP